MKNKNLPFSIFMSLNGWLLGIILIFGIAGLVTTYSGSFLSGSLKQWSKDINAGEFLIQILQSENHYFYQQMDEEGEFLSISDFALKLAANVQPTDIRTFLGRELPGFSIFDTEIFVAGEGTTYTTLPIESAPPMEVLLKEREIANEKLQELEEGHPPSSVPGEKSVLIYHTHSWESFMPLLKGVTKSSEAVSSNEKVNVVAVGEMLANALNERGIGTQHDTTNMTAELQEKDLTYNDSYTLSRELVQEVLAANNKLNFLIDIHRDSQPKNITTKTINGESYARLFFIVGEEHKNYEQNLKIATELNEKLEAKYPGISRGVIGKGKNEGNGIYNQDLSNRAILVEFGGVENTLTELKNTVDAFAEIFSEHYMEAEMVNG